MIEFDPEYAARTIRDKSDDELRAIANSSLSDFRQEVIDIAHAELEKRHIDSAHSKVGACGSNQIRSTLPRKRQYEEWATTVFEKITKLRIFHVIERYPFLTMVPGAYLIGLLICMVVGRNEIGTVSDLFGVLFLIGTAFPALFMVRAFIITVPILVFLVVSYWLSMNNRKLQFLRIISSSILGLFWISLVIATFGYPFMQ